MTRSTYGASPPQVFCDEIAGFETSARDRAYHLKYGGGAVFATPTSSFDKSFANNNAYQKQDIFVVLIAFFLVS